VDVAPGWGGLGLCGQYFFSKNKRNNGIAVNMRKKQQGTNPSKTD
jgi:hypothetical protein